MSADRPSGPSQEEIDRNIQARTLHDAEPMQGGAKVHDGILHPTAIQIETMKQESPDAKEARGSLKALYGGPGAEPLPSIEGIDQEGEHTAKLEDNIRKALEPYAGIFADKIPPVSENKRNWRGKTKVGSVETVRWTDQETVGRTHLEYESDLEYVLGETENEVKG